MFSDLAPEALSEINSLISKRLELKMARDFKPADALQAELRDRLGVEVDDRRRTWRVAYGDEGEDYY